MSEQMRLSEAIRLGAMTRPKATGQMFDAGATCALGAAADAIGQLQAWGAEPNYDPWCDRWPLLRAGVINPVGGDDDLALLEVIVALNDSHDWTREQIADWVETIERAEDEKRRS